MTEIRGPTYEYLKSAMGNAGQPASTPNVAGTATGNVATPGSQGVSGTPFAQAFEQALTAPEPVKFSRHAADRVRARGIALTPTELDRLGRAVDAAAAKGAKDSLVVSGSLSFVVNVPSRTVVTALSGSSEAGTPQVFTQIDSAVLL